MIESDFTRNVNNRLNPAEVFSWKINDNFKGGVPDNWYIGLRNDKNKTSGKIMPLFVEYKYLQTLPKRETTVIIPALSSQQFDWLRMLIDSGHPAMVIIGANFGRCSKGVILETHEWEDGVPLKDFMERAVDYAGLAKAITSCCFGVAKK